VRGRAGAEGVVSSVVSTTDQRRDAE
jgi:hypothetical protein